MKVSYVIYCAMSHFVSGYIKMDYLQLINNLKKTVDSSSDPRYDDINSIKVHDLTYGLQDIIGHNS